MLRWRRLRRVRWLRARRRQPRYATTRISKRFATGGSRARTAFYADQRPVAEGCAQRSEARSRQSGQRIEGAVTELVEGGACRLSGRDSLTAGARRHHPARRAAAHWRGASGHPTMHEIVGVFQKLGYSVAEGPVVETDYYNFEALNFPPNHPARDTQDTLFIAGQQSKPQRERLSAAHAYLSGADSYDGDDAAADSHCDSRDGASQRSSGCEPLADVPSD